MRLLLRECAFTALAFTAACYVYFAVTVWGMQDQLVESPVKTYMLSPLAQLEILTGGPLFGVMIGVIYRVMDTPRVRDRPFAQVVLMRTVLTALCVVVAIVLVWWLFRTFLMPPEELAAVADAITTRTWVSVSLWVAVTVGIINLMLELGHLVGPGNLWKLAVGRYRRPRSEDRVFLFMDLKGSTTAAEQLGHDRYSAMIQECYRAITEVVLRHGASIYQYVGDEVVLTWNRTPETERRSVYAYFAFTTMLEARAPEFEARFGWAPEFRGGIDSGTVTVLEVGDIKREIVYHGDPLNTASRLMEMCKTRGDALIVSAPARLATEEDPELEATWTESVLLRGKRRSVEATGLRRSSAITA
jgi:adenylate cyclase